MSSRLDCNRTVTVVVVGVLFGQTAILRGNWIGFARISPWHSPDIMYGSKSIILIRSRKLPLLRTFWPGITPLFAFKPSILTRLHHRIEYAGRQTWSWIRAQEDRLNGRGGIRLLAVTLSRDRSPRHKYHHLRNKNRRPRLHSPRKSRRGGAIPTPERRQPRCQPLCRAALLPQHQHHRT